MQQNWTDGRYDTIADFLSAVDLPCRNLKNKDIVSSFLDQDRAHWYGDVPGCRTGRDVIKVMRDGWPAGRDRMHELRATLQVPLTPVDMRRRPLRTSSGDTLDMPSVWSGRLDIAWRTAKRQSTVGPQRIDICANMICSGGEHADVLFWRGAAAAVLADVLEQAGYMVRLTVNFGGKSIDRADARISCRITVKDHGMPFDISSVSAVILPGFFRALGHAWINNHAPVARETGGIAVGQGIVEAGEISFSHEIRDHGSALAAIERAIERINDNAPVAA